MLPAKETAELLLQFDPAYRPDRHSRAHSSSIEVSYKEHPHKVVTTIIISHTLCMLTCLS